MGQRNYDLATALSQLFLYVLLVGAVLFMVFNGSTLFQNVTTRVQANEHLRATTFYLQNQVAANDRRGAVSVAQGPEGKMLAMEQDGDYVLYVYTWQGWLLEELGTKEGPNPAKAQRIAPVSRFGLTQVQDMIRAEVDGVTVWLCPQCGGGEADG